MQTPVTRNLSQQQKVLFPKSISSLNNGEKMVAHSALWLVMNQNALSREQYRYQYEEMENRAQVTQLLLIDVLRQETLKMRLALQSENMYRQLVKKEVNKMVDVSAAMHNGAYKVGAAASAGFCRAVLAGLENEYIAEGTDMITLAQMQFSQFINDTMQHFFISCKQALDDINYPHSLSCARILVSAGMAEFFINVTTSFHEVIKSRTGFIPELISPAPVEEIRTSGTRLLEHLVRKEVPEESGLRARAMLDKLTKIVLGDEMVELIKKAEHRLQFEYTEYFLASICMSLNAGTPIKITVLKTLFFKLRDKKRIIKLLSDLKAIPVTDSEGNTMDVMDLSLEMPNYSIPSLNELRYLSMSDKRRYTEKEIRNVTIDLLRKEIQENNGVLPMGSLKQLYSEYGTKKAMQQLFTEMGTDGKETLKVLKYTFIGDLKMK